ALLGLTILAPPAAAAPLRPAPGASLWQQAWAFLFGGGLTSLWAEEGGCMDPNGKPTSYAQASGLTSLRGEDGSCIDPAGRSRPGAQASRLVSLRGEDGGFMDPNGQHSTNTSGGVMTNLRDAGRLASHRR